LYKVTYNISWADSDINRRNVRAYCRINGTTTIVPSVSYAYARNTTDARATNTACFYVNLNSGDYIEVLCEQSGTGGTARTIANESWITIEFIR